MAPFTVNGKLTLQRKDLSALFERLHSEGYRIVGPTVRDGAIVYGDLQRVDDLPIGWTERQEAGKYRLERRSDSALFGYNLGPHSWKNYLYPSHERLWSAHRSAQGFEVEPADAPVPKYAFLGVRACEIAAIEVQDRVFEGPHGDPGYTARRTQALVIAVGCSQAASTCFCTSMNTGPRPTRGFDLSLTELLSESDHRFVVEIGSEKGAAILEGLPLAPAAASEAGEADAVLDRTAASILRRMDTTNIHDLLLGNMGHPQWQKVAKRCLSCTNCTMVCPTCFCSTTEEVPDLDGERVEKWRRWDSCFNLEFTELGKSSVRKTTASRYRQWLTHKLASWQDQFGTSGCVGCGRCIAWCPVGIDLTEEVAAIRGTAATQLPMAGGSR